MKNGILRTTKKCEEKLLNTLDELERNFKKIYHKMYLSELQKC